MHVFGIRISGKDFLANMRSPVALFGHHVHIYHHEIRVWSPYCFLSFRLNTYREEDDEMRGMQTVMKLCPGVFDIHVPIVDWFVAPIRTDMLSSVFASWKMPNIMTLQLALVVMQRRRGLFDR